MAPIVLGILIGTVVCIGAVIRRKRGCALMTLPFPLLILAGLVLASIPPKSEREFDRIFGESNRAYATAIATRKPIMMDGYFIWFQMSQEAFDKRIRPQFKEIEFTNFHLLREQKLPAGWPQNVASATSALYKEIDFQDVLVYYDIPKRTAYASVIYDRW